MDTHAVEQVKAQLESVGYSYVPKHAYEDAVSLLEQIGTLVPQYDGRLLWEIEPQERFDDHYHSLNTKKLSPHTECYEFEGDPPKYLALWCIRPATCGGGQTTLFDSKQFLAKRSENEVQHLRRTKYKFHSSSGIQVSDLGKVAIHSLLDGPSERSIFRFSRNCVDFDGCEVAAKFADDLVDAFENDATKIDWDTGNLLIWDNHRVVHSRTSFKDRNRSLMRAWLS